MNQPVDIKKVRKAIKELNIPKDYWGIDVESFFEYQWNLYISIRETAGKTTQSLILGLILHELYPEHYCIEYIRNDASQTTQQNVDTLFATVEKFDYISKITKGKYNSVQYYRNQKRFYLVKKDEDGAVLYEDTDYICAVHSVEKWQDFKSGYNNPRGNYIVLDEFQDTDRATYLIFSQLLNIVSTIGRPFSVDRTPWLHILMMGNNTDEYCFYFDDFGISDQIRTLKFGGSITFRTEYNTTGICKLLELGETQKERLRTKNIPFLGFPGKKAAAFTGSQEWAGKTYRHPEWELDYEECYFRRAYILHRGRWIQFDFFRDSDHGKYIFLHFASEPLKNDNVVFTLEPCKDYHIYGLGKYEKRERIRKICEVIRISFIENRMLYASNMVGALFDDFMKNVK